MRAVGYWLWLVLMALGFVAGVLFQAGAYLNDDPIWFRAAHAVVFVPWTCVVVRVVRRDVVFRSPFHDEVQR